jgi:hypothetical protein
VPDVQRQKQRERIDALLRELGDYHGGPGDSILTGWILISEWIQPEMTEGQRAGTIECSIGMSAFLQDGLLFWALHGEKADDDEETD